MKNESTGWKFGTLLTFDGTDGNYPNGGLILDDAGNLYGTTNSGGDVCCGTVFEVKHGANDTWTESLLYSFTGGTDGGFPHAPLVSNGPGKLYGTTMTGGDLSCGSGGCGVVFEVSLSEGIWTETVLHSFTDSPDGNDSSGSYDLRQGRESFRNHCGRRSRRLWLGVRVDAAVRRRMGRNNSVLVHQRR
jgi:hypothetical protein